MRVQVVTPPRLALDRLVCTASRDLGSAAWWAGVARGLDGLCEELASTDMMGLAQQITTDAPHYANAARRLPEMADDLLADARGLRLLIAELAGPRRAATGVACDRLDALLRRVTSLHRLSNALLLDAYDRDLGGEW